MAVNVLIMSGMGDVRVYKRPKDYKTDNVRIT